MDDVRIEWIRNEVYMALEIADREVFDNLLNREDGINESLMQRYLNETPEEGTALILHSQVIEEEEEIEVEIGKVLSECEDVHALVTCNIVPY